MIPIRPADGISCEKANHTWYLKEIKSIEISKSTYYSWRGELESLLPSLQGERCLSDKGSYFERILDLWDRCLAICGELTAPPVTLWKENAVEKLLTASYEELFRIREILRQYDLKKLPDKRLKLLDEVGRQMRLLYNRLPAKGINRRIVAEHGVYVCPYCGASTIGNLLNGKAAAQLDHFFPKSEGWNALFAVSLFNLVPSCPTCNHTKGEKQLNVSPYDANCGASDVVFRYRLWHENVDICQALKSREIDLLLTTDGKEIPEPPKQASPPRSEEPLCAYGYGNDAVTLGYAEYETPDCSGGTAVKYTYLKDVAIDFLWQDIQYTKAYKQRLREDFEPLDALLPSAAGTNETPFHFTRIPLAKLRYDLHRQPHLDGEEPAES